MVHDWIFIDTSFLIASENEEDRNYKKTQKILLKFKENPSAVRLIFTDYIFDEYITYLKMKNVNNESISRIGNGLLVSKILHLYFISTKQFHEAWEKLLKFKDKSWSFTDCTSFVVMEDMKIKFHLSYDGHFDQASFIFWPASSSSMKNN